MLSVFLAFIKFYSYLVLLDRIWFLLYSWTFTYSRTYHLFWYLVKRRRQRCLDATQISTYYQWHSFKNMIKSIPSFKESELESVILWNRILVYATLYGQAKKVSDVLKRYNIHLSNPSLDEFTYSAAPFIMMNNVNYLESYVSASDTVSNFSINSSSGSGGFSGGGFSGGGGGGGGGAF
ncbi:MAG: DUF2207 family protein [Streptococcus salivarius]